MKKIFILIIAILLVLTFAGCGGGGGGGDDDPAGGGGNGGTEPDPPTPKSTPWLCFTANTAGSTISTETMLTLTHTPSIELESICD